MSTEFAVYLRCLRKQQKLTQAQLAAKALISLRTLNYWESGQRQPRTEELKSVLDALNLPLGQQKQLLLLLTSLRGIQMAREQVNSVPSAHTFAVNMPDLGNLLAALRQRRGWSREHLAAELGVQVSTISRWENTAAFPSEVNLERLCSLLGVQPEEQSALLVRRLLPQIWEDDNSSEALTRRVDEFCLNLDNGRIPLVDLQIFMLKRQLWFFGRYDQYHEALLARVEEKYGTWLLAQDRFAEAECCARHTLLLVTSHKDKGNYVSSALNIVEYCTFVRNRTSAEADAKVIRKWL